MSPQPIVDHDFLHPLMERLQLNDDEQAELVDRIRVDPGTSAPDTLTLR